MSEQITNEDIAEFLKIQSTEDVTDFGYMLIPNDARLNDEAISNIKDKWKAFCIEKGIN